MLRKGPGEEQFEQFEEQLEEQLSRAIRGGRQCYSLYSRAHSAWRSLSIHTLNLYSQSGPSAHLPQISGAHQMGRIDTPDCLRRRAAEVDGVLQRLIVIICFVVVVAVDASGR